MIEQITQGIRIAVCTYFKGIFYHQKQEKFAFGYHITIENHSNDVVQLQSRFWTIKDALNNKEYIEGEGVIGKKPVINPGEKHSYHSGCLLNTAFGSMKGYYNMVNFTSTRKVKVIIPSFKLSAPFALN
ncbi:Co2+/Mg2+ efflux protein ApaG [Zunongwangia sp.]|uniref:Co2+/Mg2+ efflux protein ApaG n=1 Tax=Zunongwangia sp. TaxID=1965325 RepID=UPI003AA97C96